MKIYAAIATIAPLWAMEDSELHQDLFKVLRTWKGENPKIKYIFPKPFGPFKKVFQRYI
jgi:hypothetical protein